MGKIKDSVKKIADPLHLRGMFEKPETPDMPTLPSPTLMEDTAAIEKARRRAVAAGQQRSGASSTALSSRTGTLLGGG